MGLGEKIYKLRKLKGISQEGLAELVGVSRQTIYKWESDYVQPNAENIKVLCEVFSVGKEYFFDNIQPSLNEAAISEYKHKNNMILIICLIIGAVILLVCLLLTFVFGSLCNTPNKGYVYETTTNIEYGVYLSMLIVSVIVAIVEIILIVLVCIRKTRCKLNSNQK